MRGSKPEPEQSSPYRGSYEEGLSRRRVGRPSVQIRAQYRETRCKTPDILRPSILLTAGMKPGGRLTGRISFELR
jgi:hypothetical protein